MRSRVADHVTEKFIVMLLLTVGIALLALSAIAGGLKTGEAFPDLATFKLEGALPDIKGKVVLVDFWASWCEPCQKSFPAMNELQQKFGAQGFAIIAVNVDENRADMEKFLKGHPANFAVVRDAKQALVDKVSIGTMPSSFLLDREGKVVAAHSGFEGDATKKKYDAEISALLK